MRSAYDKDMGHDGDITTVLEPQLKFDIYIIYYIIGCTLYHVVLVTFSDLILNMACSEARLPAIDTSLFETKGRIIVVMWTPVWVICFYKPFH